MDIIEIHISSYTPMHIIIMSQIDTFKMCDTWSRSGLVHEFVEDKAIDRIKN